MSETPRKTSRTTSARTRTGPAKGTELWLCEGPVWTYRKPLIVRGRWRVRRRSKLDGKVEQLTLKAPVTGGKGRGITNAKREIKDRVADEWQEHEAEKKRAPVPKDIRDITLGIVLERWLKTLDTSPATAVAYQRDAMFYRKLLGEQRKLREIAFSDVMELFTGKWKKASGRTKIKHRGALIRIFDFGIALGVRDDNPAQRISIQKGWRDSVVSGAEVGQALTIEEGRKLLAACRETYVTHLRPDVEGSRETEVSPPEAIYWAVLISLRTGLRWSNVVGSDHKPGLLWSCIDLDEGLLSIPRDQMKNRLPYRAPIHVELLEELRRRLREIGRVPKPTERVVPPARDLRKSFRSALLRAGLAAKAKEWRDSVFLGELADPDSPHSFRIHDLRHSACTWIDDAASSTIAKILKGDSMRGSDARYFRHKKMGDLRTALDRVPRLLTDEQRSETTVDDAAGAR